MSGQQPVALLLPVLILMYVRQNCILPASSAILPSSSPIVPASPVPPPFIPTGLLVPGFGFFWGPPTFHVCLVSPLTLSLDLIERLTSVPPGSLPAKWLVCML